MKKILLITSSKTDRTKELAKKFADKIADALEYQVSVSSCLIYELAFSLSQDDISIHHREKKFNLKDFDLIIMRTVGHYKGEAKAIALYCEYFGIKYTDSYLNRILHDKLSMAFLLWVNDIKWWPSTYYGPTKDLSEKLIDLGGRAVLKDNKGAKGNLNFLVNSTHELKSIAEEHSDTQFILQEFIPNDSDLRILVLNYKPVLVIKRTGSSDSHLNNTSQGGSAQIIPLTDIDKGILDVAVKASRVAKLEVSGVDIVIDKDTGKFYLLEINNAPQISSGSFMEEKAEVYADMIKDLIK